MVNPPSPHVGRIFHKLMEAQINENCGEEVSGLLVEAYVEVTGDDGWPSHVDQLLQVVHNVLQATSFRPDKSIMKIEEWKIRDISKCSEDM